MALHSTSTLIRTKLLPPPNRSQAIKREKLNRLFLSSLTQKLALVTAPAGFGKTTLLGQWFGAMQELGLGLCWLSLDANDNDPETFLRYFIAALRNVDDEIGGEAALHLDNVHSPDISNTLGSLVNDLAIESREIFLFLDDFHFIASPEINQFVELLLNLSPPNFHLVISSRKVPDLPLANMRVHNDLLHINADRLRFDADESERFLVKSHGLQLPKELLTSLYERCEGWAAGLQLASLSIKEADSQEAFITGFSGKIRDVTDYLATAVLDSQPEPIRSFLLDTAILDRLSADLCNCVHDCSDSHEILQKIEADNLFIVPLDKEGIWYRYHSLFQEFLLTQINRDSKSRLDTLNDKASRWFRQRGYFREAVDYALRANNMPEATELIERRAIAEFMDGRMPRVASWINRIPRDVLLQHPRLMLLHGTALYHMNQADEAARVYKLLEQRVSELTERSERETGELDELKEDLEILRAGIDMSLDNASEVIQKSPKELHSRQDFLEGAINNIKGYSYFVLGEFENARRYISNARQAHRQIESEFGMMYSDCFLGMLEFYQGNLQLARQVFEQGLPTGNNAGRSPYTMSAREVVLAALDYEMNVGGESLNALQSNLRNIEQVGHISLMQLGYITAAKHFTAEGKFELGMKMLDRLSGLYPKTFVNLNQQLLVAYNRIKLLLRSGKRPDALRIATSLAIPLEETLPDLTHRWDREAFLKQLIQSRLWLVGGQKELLISTAERLYEQTHQIGLGYLAIECLLLLSKAHLKFGQDAEAESTLQKALNQAAANNIISIFVDEGTGLLPLINKIQRRSGDSETVLKEFTAEIIRAFDLRVGKAPDRKMANGESALVEPLSQRELDVLQLMAEGKSNAHIAEKLHISQNTVKWHGRNVFAKMHVKNRTEAVITAQDLGLLTQG